MEKTDRKRETAWGVITVSRSAASNIKLPKGENNKFINNNTIKYDHHFNLTSKKITYIIIICFKFFGFTYKYIHTILVVFEKYFGFFY